MTSPRWNPPVALSTREARVYGRVAKKRKLFSFLRDHRHELFDEEFQVELEQMYRPSGAGKEPVPPALMAMVLLLQCYSQASDAEAVELAVCDLRWQLVLGCLGSEDAPFSQGALYDFRQRFIEHDMDIVFKIAQQIHVLKYGAVLAQGTAEDIRRNQDVIDAYLGTDHHLAEAAGEA